MLIQANSIHIPLADRVAQCCVTSPPYYGLRSYGIGAENGEIGLEGMPEAYVEKIVAVFREVRRVLRDDGTLWLVIGDSYASGEIGRHDSVQGRVIDGKPVTSKTKRRQQIKLNTGLKPKDLVGIPWRVAFALQADGWYLRSDIIWAKPNPLPESVMDRPTKSHEYVFLLSKSQKYYYDREAIVEPSTGQNGAAVDFKRTTKDHLIPGQSAIQHRVERESTDDNGTRNRRTVWTIPTSPYSGAHFATFPPALVEPCILAGSAKGDIVLDPFCGTGTVGMVAHRHGRRFVGLDLNAQYLEDFALPRAERTQTAASMVALPLFESHPIAVQGEADNDTL